MSPRVLVVDDDPSCLYGICQILTDEGLNVTSATSGREALEKLNANSIDVVVTDEKIGDLRGMELLSRIKKLGHSVPVILMTAYGSVSLAVEALKQGAFYFFEKPICNNLDQFLAILRQALKTQQMEREINHLRKEVSDKYSFPNIIGDHPKMLEIFEIIGRVAETDRTILIQGESGTGKDLIAKTIHYNSLRKERPLITVNCGALTDTLLTTELFGHTKGAFTGAIKDQIGRFQMAEGGTLFLDEIGEVPFHLQKTLLKVIEDKEFEKVGDSRPIKVDVRIIAATNRDLKEQVAKGNFREDLYYRLSIVPVTIPPLRERVSDIPLLVKHYLKKYQEGDIPIGIEPQMLENLEAYPWPGNVRELANVLQQMMVFCKNNTITMNDLPPHLLYSEEKVDGKPNGKIHLSKMVSDLERKWILNKLDESRWNKGKAAELLCITRKMLDDRIDKYQIRNPKKGYLRASNS